MSEMLKQLTVVWGNFSRHQKLLVGGLTGVLFLSLLGAILLGSSTEYVLLASDLEASDAQKLAGKLADADIPYRVSGTGDLVTVDSSRREEARQLMLQEGFGPTGSLGGGYSALTEAGMSMTEDQRKEWMKALQEQELARTIRTYNKNVRKAKVHITTAVRRSFRRGDEPAKAVVSIANEHGTYLEGAQVEAIQIMVASAVAGLKPKHVAVIDSSGRNLASDPALRGESDAYSVSKRRREEDLERKLNSALAAVLGADDAIVRVSIALDRERIESTDKTIDKGSKVVSREKVESAVNSQARPSGIASSEAQGKDATRNTSAGTGSTTEKVESDYEYSTKMTRRIKEAGAIQRLTVAVFVNSDPNDPERDRRPILKQLEETARATVGLDTERGDTLALQLIPFATPPTSPPPSEPGFMENPQYLKWVQWGAAILFGLVITWWFMRGVKKAKVGLRQALEESRARQAAHESQKIAKPGDGTNEDPSKDIAAVIDSNPEAVGRLLRNWMYEAVK